MPAGARGGAAGGLRANLRLQWVAAHALKLGEEVRGFDTQEAARNAWNAWWVRNYDKLPSCQAPGDPLPVLVDERGVIVGLLSNGALAVPTISCEETN